MRWHCRNKLFLVISPSIIIAGYNTARKTCYTGFRNLGLKLFSSMVNTQRLRLAFLPEMRLNLNVVSCSFNQNSKDPSTYSKLSLYRFLILYPRVRVVVMCQMWAEDHNAFLHSRKGAKTHLLPLHYSLVFKDAVTLTACIVTVV